MNWHDIMEIIISTIVTIGVALKTKEHLPEKKTEKEKTEKRLKKLNKKLEKINKKIKE